MIKSPDISVVLPVYNGMRHLEESVASVLGQTLQNFDFIICDDCSTDESYAYLAALNDPRIRLSRNESNLGLFKTLNNLIRQADTPYVHLWAQDDVMSGNCLEESLAFHTSHPDLPLSFSSLSLIDDNGIIVSQVPLWEEVEYVTDEHHAITSIMSGCMPGNISTVTVTKEDVVRVGFFDETMKFSGDFDMWCKMSRGKGIGHIGKRLIKLRAHSGQLSMQKHMQIYRLRESQKILADFYSRVNPKDKKRAHFALQWRIATSFFNELVFLARKADILEARQYWSELKRHYALVPLFFRWVIVKFLRTIKLERYFYQIFLYNGIKQK